MLCLGRRLLVYPTAPGNACWPRDLTCEETHGGRRAMARSLPSRLCDSRGRSGCQMAGCIGSKTQRVVASKFEAQTRSRTGGSDLEPRPHPRLHHNHGQQPSPASSAPTRRPACIITRPTLADPRLRHGALSTRLVQLDGCVAPPTCLPQACCQLPCARLCQPRLMDDSRNHASRDSLTRTDIHNRLVADILTRYRTLTMLATVQAEEGDRNNATPETMAVAGISMKMEFDGLVRPPPPFPAPPSPAAGDGCPLTSAPVLVHQGAPHPVPPHQGALGLRAPRQRRRRPQGQGGPDRARRRPGFRPARRHRSRQHGRAGGEARRRVGAADEERGRGLCCCAGDEWCRGGDGGDELWTVRCSESGMAWFTGVSGWETWLADRF